MERQLIAGNPGRERGSISSRELGRAEISGAVRQAEAYHGPGEPGRDLFISRNPVEHAVGDSERRTDRVRAGALRGRAQP